MARRHISDVVRHAVLEELRAGVAARTLSRKYEISEATISRWKKQAGIDEVPFLNAVVRSKPLRSSEAKSQEASSDDSPTTDRRGLIRKQLALIDDLLEEGHLKSSDLRNLAQASKVLGEADARFDREEQEEQARASLAMQHTSSIPRSKGSDLDTLIELDARGAPRNLECHFSILDVGDARERFGPEEQERAWERMVEIFRRYGHEVDEDTYQYMISKLNNDFEEDTARKERQLERLRRQNILPSVEAEADYNGEGRS